MAHCWIALPRSKALLYAPRQSSVVHLLADGSRPSAIRHLHGTAPVSTLLLLSALTMQGCMAGVWLTAVGIDMTRTSDIEFQSFEHSWGLAPQERPHPGLVKSMALMPFLGDTVMADRWAAVFQQLPDLRVVSPSTVARQGHLNVTHALSHRLTAPEQIELAQWMSMAFQVDSILFGTVIGQEPQEGFVGLKERSTWRLSLRLVSAEGILIWSTELPYTVVKGAKDLDEEMVTRALLTHVRTHADEIELPELEARHQGTASRSPTALEPISTCLYC